MNRYSKKVIDNVWKYINAIPKDKLDNSVEIIYERDCPKLNISDIDLSNILKYLKAQGLISDYAGYFEGGIILF